MAFFAKAAFASLYLGPKTNDDSGYVAYLLAEGVSPPGDSIELAAALTNQDLGGSFLFSPNPLDFGGNAAAQEKFCQAIWEWLRANFPRGIFWITHPETVAAAVEASRFNPPFLGLSPRGNSVTAALVAPIVAPSLLLEVSISVGVELVDTTIEFGGTQSATIRFNGAARPAAEPALSGALPFSGPKRAAICFSTFIVRQSLHDAWNWGFQTAARKPEAPGGMVSQTMPFAGIADGTGNDSLGFDITIDPSDPTNVAGPVKSILLFTGGNRDEATTVLASCFRTLTGDGVTLYPVGSANVPANSEPGGLIFSLGQKDAFEQDSFQVSPQGDFIIDTPVGADRETAQLLPGLSGTELFSLRPGTEAANASRFRFTSRQPAFAPSYPPQPYSPVAKPVDPNAPLLDTTLMTSWTTLLPPPVPGSRIAYAAQPQGSPLFGDDPIIVPSYKTLLGSMDPGSILPDDGTPPFPIFPYAHAVTQGKAGADALQKFETLVIAPTRRAIVGKAAGTGVASVRAASARGLAAAAFDASFNTTTPSGLIATITTEARESRWSKILLGQTITPAATEMAFKEPTPALQQAFNTNQLFLVVANKDSLVDVTRGSFANRLNIENWLLEANIGASPGYDDYANVMIVKGIGGPLYDPNGPADANLVANPALWTQRDTFASPSVDGNPRDPGQINPLSSWLQSYFAAAALQKGNPYFSKFNTIAKSHDWTGILILRARIADVPTDLAGIMAGIADPTRFYAHHFAISISQVKKDADNGIGIDQQSSVFGLVYYVDPNYDEAKPDQPVAPTAGQPYDYRVLTLKVLFENTAVTNFSSFTQITLNRLFGAPVDHMGPGGNGYNSIIMAGTYQNNEGKPVYNMSTNKDWTFYFDSPVLNKVEITGAQMNTVSAGSPTTNAAIWFSFGGFMDFFELRTPPVEGLSTPFDLFSFGNYLGQDYRRQGLSFGNLGLSMTYPVATPAKRTMTFDAGKMRFDMQTSTPRKDSLYSQFALTFEGLIGGDAKNGPRELGYLDLVTDLRLTGVADSIWYGLRYRLDMGSPGQLAGNVGLVSTLLTAWTPASGTGDAIPASANLSLPGAGAGAKLISLQTVLSLSVGTLRLTFDTRKNGFLLMMTEIALKLFGLLKIPPNGATAFYLFGNPKAGGSPSGLGWYAIYNNMPVPPKLLPSDLERL